MLIVLQGITQPMIELEYKNPNKQIKGISLASAIGLLVGALFWGFSADIIGEFLPIDTSTIEATLSTLPLDWATRTDSHGRTEVSIQCDTFHYLDRDHFGRSNAELRFIFYLVSL